MILEVGHLTLIFALLMALGLTLVPLWGSFRGHYAAMRLAPSLELSGVCVIADEVKQEFQQDLEKLVNEAVGL